MKNKAIILFLFLIVPFLYSASNQNHGQSQKEARTPLQDAQETLVKQAFLLIKPESQKFVDAHKSVQNFIKKENTDKVLIGLRQLFSDRNSYLKALALQAEAENYSAFGALLYNKMHEEELLVNNTKEVKNSMIQTLFSISVASFLTGMSVCYLFKK